MGTSGGRVRVGVSGWTYPHWRGDFYPPGLVHRDELAFLAERMGTTEVNGSFYSLQRPDSYRAWRSQVPHDFTFAVKGSRFLTHMKRLRDVEPGLANFFASGVLALGAQLGPVLWQLPPNLVLDPDVLDSFLARLPTSTSAAAELAADHDHRVPPSRAWTTCEVDVPVRHALEPRHPSFDTDEAADVLRRHQVACVRSDAAGHWPELDRDTADFRYVRLHGHSELYTSGYAPATLDTWARRCRTWARTHDVYVYFDNDAHGRAPHDALALADQLG